MQLSLSMKVGLVSLFSCLTLLLSLLSPRGMALAHTANHSSTTSCPKGTVSAVMRDQQGNALHAICIDTAGDPPLFDIPDWNTSQDREKD